MTQFQLHWNAQAEFMRGVAAKFAEKAGIDISEEAAKFASWNREDSHTCSRMQEAIEDEACRGLSFADEDGMTLDDSHDEVSSGDNANVTDAVQKQ